MVDLHVLIVSTDYGVHVASQFDECGYDCVVAMVRFNLYIRG